MPRMKNETSALVADLHRRIDEIVSAARNAGRDEALSQIRHLVGGGAAAPARRGPGRPPKSASAAPSGPRKKRKNSWAGLSAEARLARINAIRKGKGLAPREK
jgi:hypothetical protein